MTIKFLAGFIKVANVSADIADIGRVQSRWAGAGAVRGAGSAGGAKHAATPPGPTALDVSFIVQGVQTQFRLKSERERKIVEIVDRKMVKNR